MTFKGYGLVKPNYRDYYNAIAYLEDGNNKVYKYNNNDGIEYESEDDGIEYYMY